MKNIHKTPSKSINNRTSGKQSLTALWKTFQQFSSSRSTKTSSISSRCPFTFETPSRNSFSERFRQKNKVSNVNIRGDLKIFFSFKAKLWPQANSISIKVLDFVFHLFTNSNSEHPVYPLKFKYYQLSWSTY